METHTVWKIAPDVQRFAHLFKIASEKK